MRHRIDVFFYEKSYKNLYNFNISLTNMCYTQSVMWNINGVKTCKKSSIY